MDYLKKENYLELIYLYASFVQMQFALSNTDNFHKLKRLLMKIVKNQNYKKRRW